ncbi:MAG: hypothetical protein K6F00_08200 [Lachnospiraceae bacterium]|nr:hypothetical protein [Lachnospiraceae bacterium]
MIYESQRQKLEVVQISCQNEVNDVCIARDINSSAGTLYTLIILKNHELVKKLLVVMESTKPVQTDRFIDSFSYKGNFILVFPYREERPISRFYMGESYPLTKCEDICINTLITCIDSRLPWSILYLILTQGQMHLAADDSVYLGFQIDFSNFDESMGEKDCTRECARLLLSLLECKSSQKAISYQLLQKKTENDSYQKFTELYRDVRITAVSKERKGIKAVIYNIFVRNKDVLFAILIRVSVVLAVIALVAFITQIIFGDIVWLSIFFNHFKKIGTESLLK